MNMNTYKYVCVLMYMIYITMYLTIIPLLCGCMSASDVLTCPVALWMLLHLMYLLARWPCGRCGGRHLWFCSGGGGGGSSIQTATATIASRTGLEAVLNNGKHEAARVWSNLVLLYSETGDQMAAMLCALRQARMYV